MRAGGAAVPLPAPLRSPGAGGGGDGTSPCASSGGDQRALPEVRRPSLGDRAGSSERRLLPMAGPPGHMLQAVSSADAVNGCALLSHKPWLLSEMPQPRLQNLVVAAPVPVHLCEALEHPSKTHASTLLFNCVSRTCP